MVNASSWNWDPGDKVVADLGTWEDKFEWIEELQASPNGEKVAAVVKVADEEFSACVNGEAWEEVFERVWHLRFGPDNRLVGFGADMGEWSVVVDGEAWEEKFGALWNIHFSDDGSAIAVNAQVDAQYAMAVNGVTWPNLYPDANHFAVAPDGSCSAAVVQKEAMGQAEIFKFQQGVYSVAIDGVAWESNFVNAWYLAFSADCKSVATEVRTNLYDYTVAVDGKPWSEVFQCVWAPSFNPVTNAVVAPVRLGGKWTLAQDGTPMWDGRYFQCWEQRFTADGKKIAAIVSPKFGRWTVAVDDTPWKTTFKDMLVDLTLSPCGTRAAALGKNGDDWHVISNDRVWPGKFDMAWAPVISGDAQYVGATVEKDRKYAVLVNGRPAIADCDMAWGPVFSPDSSKVLMSYVKDGKFRRRVMSASEI